MSFRESLALFNDTCRTHPDLMEPYVILLESTTSEDEQQRLIWRALRETIRQRYPLPQPAEEPAE